MNLLELVYTKYIILGILYSLDRLKMEERRLSIAYHLSS